MLDEKDAGRSVVCEGVEVRATVVSGILPSYFHASTTLLAIASSAFAFSVWTRGWTRLGASQESRWQAGAIPGILAIGTWPSSTLYVLLNTIFDLSTSATTYHTINMPIDDIRGLATVLPRALVGLATQATDILASLRIWPLLKANATGTSQRYPGIALATTWPFEPASASLW